VFQNDGEFVAGYLEMFFRNPHYFAAQNPDLFSAYMELFGYDPRKAWKQDFPHYVRANKSFYASGEIPPKPGLTIPES
jgi:Mlc titration factor MtfA (ptsG expression regulator)